jgi:hypothetical protein
MSIIRLSRVDGRVLGYFMFLFYTFQQVCRPSVIFDRTLDARAAAKRQKTGDWYDYHCMKIKFQLLVCNAEASSHVHTNSSEDGTYTYTEFNEPKVPF